MFCSVDGAHRDQPSLTHSFPPRRSADRGGDEVVVMVEGGDVALAPSVARRVANALAGPIPDIAADPIIAGGSVGIAFGTPGRFDGEQLLAEADAALDRKRVV